MQKADVISVREVENRNKIEEIDEKNLVIKKNLAMA